MKKNIIANIIGKFWSVFSNLIFIPLYIKYLGMENYAVISFAILLNGVLVLIDGGLSATLSREMAKIGKNSDKINLLQTLESCYLSIVAFFAVLLILSADYWAYHWLNLGSISPENVAMYIRIFGIGILFQLLNNFYIGGQLGLEKQVQANVLQVLWGVVRNALVVIAIYFYPNLYVFFGWQTVVTMLFCLIIRQSLYNKLQHRAGFRFKIDLGILSKVRNFALGILLIMLVAVINTQLDKLIISKMMNIENLGYYTLSVAIATGIVTVINPIAVASLPRLTMLYSEHKTAEAQALYHRLARWVSVVVFSLMAVLFLFAEKTLFAWTGDMEIAQKATVSLPFLALGFGMLALQYIPFNIAVANAYTILNNVMGISGLLITIPCYWFGFKYFGVRGVAMAFGITQTLFTLVYLYFIGRKYFNSNAVWQMFTKELLLPLIVAFALSILFTQIAIDTNNRWLELLQLLLIGAIVLAVTVLVSIPFKEIKMESLKIINRIKNVA